MIFRIRRYQAMAKEDRQPHNLNPQHKAACVTLWWIHRLPDEGADGRTTNDEVYTARSADR